MSNPISVNPITIKDGKITTISIEQEGTGEILNIPPTPFEMFEAMKVVIIKYYEIQTLWTKTKYEYVDAKHQFDLIDNQYRQALSAFTTLTNTPPLSEIEETEPVNLSKGDIPSLTDIEETEPVNLSKGDIPSITDIEETELVNLSKGDIPSITDIEETEPVNLSKGQPDVVKDILQYIKTAGVVQTKKELMPGTHKIWLDITTDILYVPWKDLELITKKHKYTAHELSKIINHILIAAPIQHRIGTEATRYQLWQFKPEKFNLSTGLSRGE